MWTKLVPNIMLYYVTLAHVIIEDGSGRLSVELHHVSVIIAARHSPIVTIMCGQGRVSRRYLA